MIQMTIATKAAHRTAQGKPTCGMRYCTMDGNTRLPKDVPVAAMASANALFFLKYELAVVTEGMKASPSPSPVQTPCARKICQYSLARLIMNVPRTASEHPNITQCLVYPASVSRPETVQMAMVSNTCVEPTQLTWDAGRPSVST